MRRGGTGETPDDREGIDRQIAPISQIGLTVSSRLMLVQESRALYTWSPKGPSGNLHVWRPGCALPHPAIMFEQAFRNIDDALRKEAGCTTELDYTEQT